MSKHNDTIRIVTTGTVIMRDIVDKMLTPPGMLFRPRGLIKDLMAQLLQDHICSQHGCDQTPMDYIEIEKYYRTNPDATFEQAKQYFAELNALAASNDGRGTGLVA